MPVVPAGPAVSLTRAALPLRALLEATYAVQGGPSSQAYGEQFQEEPEPDAEQHGEGDGDKTAATISRKKEGGRQTTTEIPGPHGPPGKDSAQTRDIDVFTLFQHEDLGGFNKRPEVAPHPCMCQT